MAKYKPIESTPGLRARLLAKIQVVGECWEWTAARSPEGYGCIHAGGPKNNMVRAHRASYTIFVGPIPDGLHLDHLCRNPPCVNPAHLEPVTPWENFRRGEAQRAIAHRTGICKRGHKREPGKDCRPCGALYARLKRQALREARRDGTEAGSARQTA